MKSTRKMLALVMTVILLSLLLLPEIPVSANTYTFVSSNSPQQYKDIPGVILCPGKEIPSTYRTLMASGGHTFQFYPGEYILGGSAYNIKVGSNTTIKGMVGIVQPADVREIMYPNPATQAVFISQCAYASEVPCNSNEVGYFYTDDTGTITTSYIHFEDIVLSGYTVMKLTNVDHAYVRDCVFHNYRGTYPNGTWCNMGFGAATGTLWIQAKLGKLSNYVWVDNCNFQMASHHSFTIHNPYSNYWTKHVYLTNCRSLHSGCGLLRSSTSERYGYGDFSTGFDLSETSSVEDVIATDCYAWDAWKVGFYTEPYDAESNVHGGQVKNLKLIRCRADDSGQRNQMVENGNTVTINIESEACNFYLQGGYLEDCVSYNGFKSGYLFHPEYEADQNTVGPGRVRLVDCVDHESPISIVTEMNLSKEIYIENFKSYYPEKYALRLYASSDVVVSNLQVQASSTMIKPVQIGFLLRQQITMSSDDDNQCKTEMPPNPAHVYVKDDPNSWPWTDYGNLTIGMTDCSLGGKVYGYDGNGYPGTTVSIYSNTFGTSKWNNSNDPAIVGASLVSELGILDEDGPPAPPEDLIGVAPTTSANLDGQITGTDTTMEWKPAAGSTYTGCTGSAIINLVPGNYNVRYKADGSIPASYDATVNVPSYQGIDNPIPLAYSELHPDWQQQDWNLGSNNTGTQYVQFYVTPAAINIDSQIAYVDSSTVLSGTGFDQLALQIRLNSSGKFDVRNAGAFYSMYDVSYSPDNEYFVEMTANMSAGTYSVWVTPPGGSKTQIANNYYFRSSAPVTNDLGRVYFISETADNLFSIRDHLVGTGKQTQNPPTGLTPYAPTTPSNNNGRITGTTTAMEWKPEASGTYTACTGSEITGLSSGLYHVRYKETDIYYASNNTPVTVPKQNRSAPTGLTGVAPSVQGGNDGKITGTTTEMEYKKSTDSTYITCSATQTTGLTAGTYNVRYKETAVYFVSPAANVTVPEGTGGEVWYSKNAATWTQYPHNLGSTNTGVRVIEYDVTPTALGIDGSVSYADTSTNVTDFSGLAMMVRFRTDNSFDVRNGTGFSRVATLAYAANVTYHVEIFANMDAHTYSVYIKPANGTRTMIANNYAFRSDAPVTNDIGKVYLISEAADNQFSVTNHTVKTCKYSIKYPDCFYAGAGVNLGTGNTGTVTINYDIIPLVSGADASVGFADSSVTVDYFDDLAMMVKLNAGNFFEVRNGSAFNKTNTVNYSPNSRYHVRIVANMTAHTYSVWITLYGGTEVQIASNYAFRSDAPVTDDVGQMFVPSEPASNQFVVFNTVVTSQ